MDDLKQVLKQKACFIIAEIGMNHDGSFGNALRLIEEAKNSGVDAVKFQLHISEAETLNSAPKPPYFTQEERFEYFKRTSFLKNQWIKLKNYAHDLGLYFIVSPFSNQAIDELEEINIDAYKIASGEITNIPMLEKINTKNKPVLISSGMSNWEELTNAINALKKNLIVIFQCSTQYPCLPENVGLNVIKEMYERFKGIIIGYSDHTLDNYASIAALLMGAKVFEKHFTLSKIMYGPDALFSLEPNQMREYVRGIVYVIKAINHPVNKDDITIYKDMKKIFEKSIVATRDMKKGETIEFKDLSFKKPGDGVRADKYKEIVGKKLTKNVVKDEKILFNHLEI